MTNTTPECEAQFVGLFRRCSGSDRVRMACEMFDLARALMIANIKAQHPGITETELRVRMFERTYSDEFRPEERNRIITRLRASG